MVLLRKSEQTLNSSEGADMLGNQNNLKGRVQDRLPRPLRPRVVSGRPRAAHSREARGT